MGSPPLFSSTMRFFVDPLARTSAFPSARMNFSKHLRIDCGLRGVPPGRLYLALSLLHSQMFLQDGIFGDLRVAAAELFCLFEFFRRPGVISLTVARTRQITMRLGEIGLHPDRFFKQRGRHILVALD